MIRCPSCESQWIGYAIPAGAVVTDCFGGGPYGSTTLALADRESGKFIDDVDRTQAVCLDCKHAFDATRKAA